MLKYITVGKGPAKVLFLHGWKMDHTCFDALHCALDTSRFTFVFADQRGYGLSRKLAGPFTITQTAKDIAELVSALQWKTFHFIGHSMAGKVLCRLLIDIPEKISSAIGITPCPPIPIPFAEPQRTLFRKAATDRETRKEIFRLATGKRLTESWYCMVSNASMQASSQDAFACYFEEWANYTCLDKIKDCQIPLMILTGEFDADNTFALMQETYGKYFASTKIQILKNCGHYPMYEIPLNLAAECEAFLKRHC